MHRRVDSRRPGNAPGCTDASCRGEATEADRKRLIGPRRWCAAGPGVARLREPVLPRQRRIAATEGTARVALPGDRRGDTSARRTRLSKGVERTRRSGRVIAARRRLRFWAFAGMRVRMSAQASDCPSQLTERALRGAPARHCGVRRRLGRAREIGRRHGEREEAEATVRCFRAIPVFAVDDGALQTRRGRPSRTAMRQSGRNRRTGRGGTSCVP